VIGLGLLVASLSVAAPPPVFVSPARGAELIAAGAVVLDARGGDAKAPFLPGARTVAWMKLRDGLGRTGRLDDDLGALARAFRKRGVSATRPVLVYGAFAEGWGEEGRIWWTLRYLGHPSVHILDGGVAAWTAEDRPTAARAEGKAEPGDFEPRPVAALRADWRAVDAARRSGAVVLDVRTRAEFDGATPYWSKRGGHVPGARHLDWKTLIGDDGRLLPVDALRDRLGALGLRPDAPIIAYCTGGVRSAFVEAALMHAGFTRAANYDGSWWDWSARSELPIER
jgi:thiosulfate/3-mercaptopyruvate sulfurtransferase